MEPEILPPGDDAGFEGVRVRMAHVKSLGIVGALLALLTMAAAVGFGLLMLFGRSLLAAALVYVLWPYVFSAELTQVVFGSPAVPFWKVFLLLAAGSAVAKMLWPAFTGRR